VSAVRVAVITASDTRTPETDVSGRVLREGLADKGFEVIGTSIVADEETALEAAIRGFLARGADCVVISGGTGVSARDRTPEAVERVCDRMLSGFGELFRALSYEEIGPAALGSRACAGQAGKQLVFALPGSPAACRLGMEKLIAPGLAHLVALARGDKVSHE
jgi:molybdenum cofactor biosynthesis protein B